MAVVKINIGAEDNATPIISFYFLWADIRRHIRTSPKYMSIYPTALLIPLERGHTMSIPKITNMVITAIISLSNSLTNALKSALKYFSSYSIGGF